MTCLKFHGLWLHVSVGLASLVSVLALRLTPVDFVWVWLGLAAPALALLSVLGISRGRGIVRYLSFWARSVSDLLLLAALSVYLAMRSEFGLPDLVLVFCVLYAASAAVRDVQVLLLVERLAYQLDRSGEGLRSKLDVAA